jgi:protoheme IX farnesyltransferase
MKSRFRWREIPGACLKLGKIRISLFAACSSLAGFILASPRLNLGFLVPWAGVLTLACGASALNQYQEKDVDGKMERTKQRPLPSNQVPPAWALIFSGLLIFSGCWILSRAGAVALILGLCAVAWYNGVYTQLKKISAFAAVPGALTGAFPPAIGWACGGGNLTDQRLWAMALFFFMWQVPHFWTIAFDRSREYREAGLPTLSDIFSEKQIRRIVFQWILGTAACSLLICFCSAVYSSITRCALLAISSWLIYAGFSFRQFKERAGLTLFRKMNHYMLAFLLLLFVDWLSAVLPLQPKYLSAIMALACW